MEKQNNDLDGIRPPDVDKSSQAIAELEEKNESISDKKTEERFFWVFAIFLIVDLFVFPEMETWGAPVSIFVLQLIFLIIWGRKCGVDDIYEVTEKILSLAGGLNGQGKK